jgi:hypothetical protein
MANVGTDMHIAEEPGGDPRTATPPLLASAVEAAGVVDLDQSHVRPPAPGVPARLHWRSLSDGILVCFLTAAPALFAAFVLRDQREPVWIILLLIAAGGFLVGGAVAGRHRRLARGAMSQGAMCGLLAATVIVIANAVRTVMLGHGLSPRTLALWLGVEVAAVVVAAVGARIGRRLYLRSRRRKAVLK